MMHIKYYLEKKFWGKPKERIEHYAKEVKVAKVALETINTGKNKLVFFDVPLDSVYAQGALSEGKGYQKILSRKIWDLNYEGRFKKQVSFLKEKIEENKMKLADAQRELKKVI